jgi:hypothetical protein
MIAAFSRRHFGLLVLTMVSPLPSALRAEEMKMGIDLGEIGKAIADFLKFMITRGDAQSDARLKNSVASVSVRLSRIAAMKRSFADFLQDKPDSITRSSRDRLIFDEELRRIDREIARLNEDLRNVDPTWSSQRPELYEKLFRIGHGKGLLWAAKREAYGPYGDIDVRELRAWIIEEAGKLEDAASDIKANLHS